MVIPDSKDVFEAAAKDDIQSVQYFLETQKIPAKTTNDREETPAHIAAKVGGLDTLRYLVGKDTRLITATDVIGNTILDLATEAGALSVVKYLLDNFQLDIHRKNHLRIGNTVLHIAAQAGQLSVLKYLIQEKVLDPNSRNDVEQPPAFLATANKHFEIVKYLVEDCKANVTITDLNENNILFMSAQNGDLTIPRYLLDEKKIDFNINWNDKQGETVLQRAARFNQLAFVKYLMEEKKANSNHRDMRGRSALHEAATKGNVDVIKYMMEQGADTEIKDLYGQTPLRVAIDRDVIECLNGTKRSRRSLSESLVVPRSTLTWFETNQINGRGSGAGRNHSIHSGEFFAFLALVSASIMGNKESWYNRRSSSFKAGILEGMDPIALDVMNSTFNFE